MKCVQTFDKKTPSIEFADREVRKGSIKLYEECAVWTLAHDRCLYRIRKSYRIPEILYNVEQINKFVIYVESQAARKVISW